MLFSKKQLFSLVVLVCVTFLATLIPSQVVLASPQGLTIPLPKFYQSLNTDLASINLKGIRVYPHKPFYFDLIVDAARPLAQNQQQTKKLANYFLAAVAIPKESMWVNLSPYEKNRIVDENLGITDLGKDLLAQDYVLKQLTSAMLNPNEPLGKDFWKRVYQKTQSQYGSTQVTLNTLNKVWIVPQKAVVYQHGLNAFVVEAKLKVMLEEDYLACVKTKDQRLKTKDQKERRQLPNPEGLNAKALQADNLSQGIIREIIIPELEKEVNEGLAFTQIRQAFRALILAQWYKKTVFESLLNQVYANSQMVQGIDIPDKQAKQKIYQDYVLSFKRGALNLIKEEADPVTGKNVARKYFTGGAYFGAVNPAMASHLTREQRGLLEGSGPRTTQAFGVEVDFPSEAMTTVDWRLDMPMPKGGKIMTDKPLAKGIKQIPFPKGKKIVVLQMQQDDSVKYAGGTVHLLKQEEHRNDVHEILMQGDWKTQVVKLEPDIVLAPNDLYDPKRPIQRELQDLSNRLGWPVDALLYQSDLMPKKVNSFVRFGRHILDKIVDGMGSHVTQIARTGYESVVRWLALHFGIEYGKGEERSAHVFYQELLTPDGREQVIGDEKSPRELNLKGEAPAIVLAPHPDDEVFIGGPILKMLEAGRNVTIFVRGNGSSGVGKLNETQY